jgi:hypothetical protein
MSNYNNLEQKLEAVFQSLLQTALPAGLTHYTGQSDAALSLPRTWSYAHSFVELVPGSATGNFRGLMEIGLQSAAVPDDLASLTPSLTAHQALVAQVRDAILQSTLAATLNAAAAALNLELTVIDVLNPTLSEEQPNGISYTNLLHLEVIAANATL